jgi:hypothetical protein
MVSEQSNFLNHAVDVQVEWPGKQTEFKFGNFTITALPAANEFDPSLHIDIHRYSISVVDHDDSKPIVEYRSVAR